MHDLLINTLGHQLTTKRATNLSVTSGTVTFKICSHVLSNNLLLKSQILHLNIPFQNQRYWHHNKRLGASCVAMFQKCGIGTLTICLQHSLRNLHMQSCHGNRFNFRYLRNSCRRHADQNQLALDRTVAQIRHHPMARIVLLLCMQVAHRACPVEDHPEHQDQACLATLPWHPCKPPGMPSPGASALTRKFSACLAGRSTPTRNTCVQPPACPRTRHDLRQAAGLICHLISAKTSLIDDTY